MAKDPEIDSLVKYALYLNDAYRAAVEAGTIESDFMYEGTIPTAPDSCKSVTDPLVEAINKKIAELKDLTDCMAFISKHVCSQLDALATETKHQNLPKLDEKAIEAVAKIQLLYPVLMQDGEDRENFAKRMRAEYIADVTSGAFTPVEVDFTTPTEHLPDACDGIADYTGLLQLILDVKDACSFDAWLSEQIDKASRDSINAH